MPDVLRIQKPLENRTMQCSEVSGNSHYHMYKPIPSEGSAQNAEIQL